MTQKLKCSFLGIVEENLDHCAIKTMSQTLMSRKKVLTGLKFLACLTNHFLSRNHILWHGAILFIE